jgi:hypothetical protein
MCQNSEHTCQYAYNNVIEFTGIHHFGSPHMSHVDPSIELRNVQWAQVHIAPEAPIGGSGDGLGPVNEAWRDAIGDGTETKIYIS